METFRSLLSEEISQVACEADAHHKEEQNLRKLGIENLDSKIREDILRANQDIVTKWEKIHGMLAGSLENQGVKMIKESEMVIPRGRPALGRPIAKDHVDQP